MKLKPMLATLVDAPFDRAGWIFEIKWDGYRILAQVERDRVLLRSRNGKDYTARYAPVAAVLRMMRHRAVLDGEAVVLDAKGHASFQRLADYGREPDARLAYVVFDLLSLDGKDLRARPLLERKRLLKKILPKSPFLRYSDHIETQGKAFFAVAKKKGLEGIMAKDAASPYRSGVRGRDWLKVKTHRRQEVIIGGFTEPTRGRKRFGALVVGVREKGKLRYVGHVGGGFDHATLVAVHRKLLRLVRKASPFEGKVVTNTPVTWVAPKLVCDLKFAEWTKEGHMRQPIFVGLREDKPAAEVVRERPVTRRVEK